jgi:D-cysteine desulfhydrase
MKIESIAARHPRVRLLDGATPVQRLHRVESALAGILDGVRLFVKRDDAMALGGGGSKLRKLEFLIGEAVHQGADTLIATGTFQSNSARLAAAAAARAGLHCELFLTASASQQYTDYRQSGNALLSTLFGATLHAAGDDADAAKALAESRRRELAVKGRRAFILPGGATSAIASLGYVACAFEIARQQAELGLRFDHILLANGSSGSHAGLLAGFAALEAPRPAITGFAVFKPAEETARATLAHARGALELLRSDARLEDTDVHVSESQLGEGYGRTTSEAIEAIRFLAAHEGLLLDPVYSGKAFAGLLEQARRGQLNQRHAILFVMTGGAPALSGYRDAFKAPATAL